VGWISVDWGQEEPWRNKTDVDEVVKNPVDLRGICDDCENPHSVSIARTEEGIVAVDLRDEAGPGGGDAPMLDRLGVRGAVLAVRRRCLEQRREAQEVGAALPGGSCAR
jgi:hypothetical protein